MLSGHPSLVHCRICGSSPGALARQKGRYTESWSTEDHLRTAMAINKSGLSVQPVLSALIKAEVGSKVGQVLSS